MDTLTEQTVQTIVDDVVDATITTCTAIDKGTDIVYHLEGTHNGAVETYFFKTADQNHAAAFRSEPVIQHYIDSNTELPTADVIAYRSGNGATETPLDRPYFVMAGLPGEHPHSGWGRDSLESAIFQMGRALGQIHDTETFETAGEVYVADDEVIAIPRPSDQPSSITLTPEGYESWPAMLSQSIPPLLEAAEEPFDTYTEDIIDYYDTHSEDIPTDDEITLTLMHGDYRFDNVLFERDGDGHPTLTGVLDWGRTVAGDRRYNLIRTAYLLDREFDSSAAREQLYRGYNETNTLTRDALFETCVPLYTLHVMAVEFKWFSQWYANKSEAWRENRRQYLCDTVEMLVSQ